MLRPADVQGNHLRGRKDKTAAAARYVHVPDAVAAELRALSAAEDGALFGHLPRRRVQKEHKRSLRARQDQGLPSARCPAQLRGGDGPGRHVARHAAGPTRPRDDSDDDEVRAPAQSDVAPYVAKMAEEYAA